MRALTTSLLLISMTTLSGCGSSDSTGSGGHHGSGASGGSGGTAASGGNGGAAGSGGTSSGGAVGSGGTSSGGAAGAGGSGHAIKTVFIILMENHSWSTIKASSSAPYINNTLVPAGGHAEQYFTPPNLHPSEPNYIWLEAGTNLGITTDDDPAQNHRSTTQHLATELQAANVPWKAYVENISGNDCPLTSSGLYGAKHVPQLFFDDVTNTNDPNSATCIAHIRPYSELATDLAANTVAGYNFITPNLCNDMHGEVLGTTCNALTTDLIKTGDNWLANNVPTILNSQAYQNGGVLFVAWDEGDEPVVGSASDGPIPFIVLSPLAKPNHSNSFKYTHSSTLRTVEEIFNLSPLADANNATDLSDFFTTFP